MVAQDPSWVPGRDLRLRRGQKLLDPNFLRPQGQDYIGTQLHGFAQGTPAGPLMNLLAHAPVAAGLATALIEIAIGLGTLLGVGALLAAFAGLAINLTLWLSATWHVHPFFLGSDSIYAIAWLAMIAGLLEAERRRGGQRLAGPVARLDGIDRREFVRGGLVAGVTLAVAGAARALAGPPAKGLSKVALGGTGTSGHGKVAGPPASASPASAVRGKVLATLDQLQVGQAVGFNAPGVGPAVLLRLADNRVVAYSRICTHAGCLVGYDPSAQILVCPCHGAEFDPARQAEAIAGPTNTPLPPISVDVSGGKVILPQ